MECKECPLYILTIVQAGTIHVESLVERDYTLGEFLDVWGGLDTSNDRTVKVIVNGQPLPDRRNHILEDKKDQFGNKLAIGI